MKLSPADHHLTVPRDLRRNIAFRDDLLAAAENDAAVQRELWRMCRDDVLFWINAFMWQFDPSKHDIGAKLPFITFPIQERLICARPETHGRWKPYDRGILWCYENNKTMACEKSRWQGASWTFIAVQVWLAGFHDNFQSLNVSRSEFAVDDGTKNSLFWKMRYIVERCPRWMFGNLSPGKQAKPDDVETAKLYLHFRRTDSEITGEASTGKAGVGGRASVIFVDEFPEIERAQEIREKTALTANVRFFNGTHLGVGTPFHQMCDPRKSPEIVRYRMHWTDHPDQSRGLYEYDPANPGIPIIHDKDYKFPADYPFVLDGTPVGGPRPGVRSPWYDQKCLDLGDSRAIAMNLDISPEGAAKQFFDPLKVRLYMNEYCRNPVWTGHVVHGRDGSFESMMQEKNGPVKVWVQPNANGRLPPARYTVGVDISMGQGASNSCIAAIDGDRSLKVLEFADSATEPKDLARLTVAICHMLRDEQGNPARMGWDATGPTGNAFRDAVLKLGFRNFCMDGEGQETTGPVKVSNRPGWYGDMEAKYLLLDDYKRALFTGVLVDRSMACLEETLAFETDKGTRRLVHANELRQNDPTGARENHGDLVIATGIAWMLAKDMADGGKKSKAAMQAAIQPGTMEWMEALSAYSGQRDRSEVYT